MMQLQEKADAIIHRAARSIAERRGASLRAALAGETPLRVVCSWCGILLRNGPPHPISHGICPRCAEKFEAS